MLTGQHTLPPVTDQKAEISQRLAWSRERTRGAHSSGANVTPFSLYNIDDLLHDIGLNVGPAVRARQWLFAWIPPTIGPRFPPWSLGCTPLAGTRMTRAL